MTLNENGRNNCKDYICQLSVALYERTVSCQSNFQHIIELRQISECARLWCKLTIQPKLVNLRVMKQNVLLVTILR
jgi:hypothetical protein